VSWLTPIFGAVVLGVAVPALLALYFLRLRRTSRPIPSTMLWKRAVEDLRANAPFQRLRFNLLLLLQLLLLTLLGLSLMQPRIDAGPARGGRTVILIDRSASMSVRDGDEQDRTRLDVARDAAIERIEALHSGGLFGGGDAEIMVVAFADDATIMTPFTDSEAAAIAAVRAIRPTDGRSVLGPALELARAFTTIVDPDAQVEPGEAPAALELWTDGRIADLEDQVLRSGESLEYHRVGRPDSRNVGIAAIAAERPYDDPGRIQVFVAIENDDDESVSVDVQLGVDGSVRAVTPVPVEVPPATEDPEAGRVPGRRQVSFPAFEQPRDAIIEVSLIGMDALRCDDVAALVVPPARQLRVALVGSEGFVLRSLLEGMPLDRLDLFDAQGFRELAAAGGVADYDVVVLHGVAIEDPPPGRYLSFGAPPGVEGLRSFGDPVEGALVRRSRDDHPVLRFVNLDQLYVSRLKKVTTGSGSSVLVDTGEGPMIVEVDRGPISVVHVAFDPLDSNWPYLRSFVNFISNSIEYLGTRGDALTSRGISPGDAIAMRLDPAATDVRIRTPDGREEGLQVEADGGTVWGPARRAGLHEISWEPADGGPRARRVLAVNQLASDERRVAVTDDVVFGVSSIQGRTVEAGGARWRDLWPWLLAAVAGLSIIEWWWWQRQAGAG
jgi:Ca-activated chloride channel family protein